MRMGAWIIALALVVMASAVMAADVSVVGTADKGAYTDSNAGDTTSVTAGHVYEVNINLQEGSNEWAGIYGSITGTITLGDGSNTFFTWTMTTLPQYIYITYTSDIDWTSVTATDATTFSSALDAHIGWNAQNEPVDMTFTASHDCGTGTTTIAALVYGDYNNDGTVSAEWPVCAYVANDTGGGTNNRAVYAAAVVADGKAYNGDTADYEAIVAASTGGTTIYFYKLG